MNNEFGNKFASSIFVSGAYSVAGGFVSFFFTSSSDNPFAWPIIIAILIFPISFYLVLKDSIENDLKVNEQKYVQKDEEQRNRINELERENGVVVAHINVLEETLKEKTSGFPTLHTSIDYLHSLMDKFISDQLVNKQRPALRSAEEVKEQSRRRREAEKSQKITQSIIEFYENLEPSLIEYKNEEFGDIDEVLQEWTAEEKQDPVSYFLNKDEYRNLSTSQKNQLALERYWKRPHSKWHIGIMYERYVGYLFEKNGYEVVYNGAKEGKKDLGRDLIAKKGDSMIIVQCKYWNQFRSVFENEIFQFFGTVFQYKHSNKGKKVKGVFYTTTTVSDLAKSFAKELGIELKENFKMDKSYPCIKCNISQVDKTKIYHLPFDQQYDNIVVEPKKGEFYCATVKEAESKGFRRAWRWKGSTQ